MNNDVEMLSWSSQQPTSWLTNHNNPSHLMRGHARSTSRGGNTYSNTASVRGPSYQYQYYGATSASSPPQQQQQQQQHYFSRPPPPAHIPCHTEPLHPLHLDGPSTEDAIHPPPPPCPMARLPVDVLLYIASLRFLTLNDIVQWRATASIFYHSIPMPAAAMILQAAFLFQIRPQRGHREQPPMSPAYKQTSFHPKNSSSVSYPQHSAVPPRKDLYVIYRDRELQDVISRLTTLLTHPEFHPRLMRCSYSFRHHYHQDNTISGSETQPQRKRERTRRDLYDYPIFLTGNPPDLVRLAIEFGHVPFVDHLLSRGFRPRDLPEYFTMIPFMMPESDDVLDLDEDITEVFGAHHEDSEIESRRTVARARHQQRQAVMMKRSLELNQIWESMRVANQELMDACSRADLPAVLKVLDATLVNARVALDDPAELEQFWLDPKPEYKGKGKQKAVSDVVEDKDRLEGQSHYGSIGTESLEQEDNLYGIFGAGVGSMFAQEMSETRQPPSRGTPRFPGSPGLINDQQGSSSLHSTQPSSSTQPTLIHRASIFKPRERVESTSGYASSSGSSDPDLYSKTFTNTDTIKPNSNHLHQPWIDGRALTSALLAICFRRNGVESPQAQAAEEAKAVPIIQEILKYDCMLTAQALGQAALGVVYSRPLGSLKRAQQSKRRLSKRPKSDSDKETNELDGITAMDLLMERMGPREWLKLIKCFLQRREFEDLAVILEQCPFKGPQLETKEKASFSSHLNSGSSSLASSSNAGSSSSLGAELGHRHQGNAAIVRELLCREAGVCGVGTRLNNFTGRGIAQTSCHVASTLHESSRVLFTGSGTRFNQSFMLPRGGFRGIGGNSSGHTGASNNHAQSVETESYHGEEDSLSGGAGVGEQESTAASRSYHAGSPSQRRDNQEQDDEDDEEEEDMGVSQDQDEGQDSNLAFGGVGSSTTSSSRPGPGIAGIAIQVQAPDYILRTLFKMGFRFFSICDLSISEARHPLALQFRHQEKINRQLIDFCMVPNLDGHGGLERDWTEVDETREDSGHAEEVLTESHIRRRRRRQRHAEIDPSEFQLHAEAVHRFLYPAAGNANRGSVSIPAFPLLTRSRGARYHSTSGISLAPSRPPVLPTPRAPSPPPVSTPPSSSPTTGQPAPTPSNKVQFVLPPVQLGESFESVSSLAATFDINNVVLDDEMPTLRLRFPSLPLNSTRYSKSRLSKSMPLPIRASMIELRKVEGESSFFFGGMYDEEDEEEVEEARRKATESHRRMVQETTTRRVREHLASDYIDLMTVGICLYQACYHKKEHLLSVLLEHRLLIAQDVLTGAVQVAASVGWKRGLEMLLVQHGDMEAEVEPIVTINSEHVHLGTSMKWDHASAAQLYPGGNSNSAGNMHQGNRTFHNYTDSGNHGTDGAPGSSNTTQGLDGLLGRGLRRHQSDSERLHRLFRSNGNNSGTNQSQQPLPPARRASFDFSRTPLFFAPSSPASESSAAPSLFTSVLPGSAPAAQRLSVEMPTEVDRPRSFMTRLSMLLPNLSHSFTGSTSSSASHFPPNFPTKAQLETRRGSLGSLGGMVTTTTAATGGGLYPIMTTTEVSSTTMVMLSSSGLWSLPNTMMLRKSRNAVVALMAACTRNDPSLVRWLVESFADIKVSHIMQALMIACDRGFVRVAKILVGIRSSRLNDQHPQEHNKSRLLFRQWLESQHQRILALTTSGSSPAATAGDPTHDSFPFLFLMESSPLLRHYFQILNTLSTCQFMSWKPPTPNSASSASKRALRRTPQEIKYSLIQVLLTPLLDVLGPIAIRKALNRMPKDCWWPVDADVRTAIDQEASRAMVHLASAIRHQRKVQQQSNRKRQKRQSLELDTPLLAKVAMNNVIHNKSSAAGDDEGAEGGEQDEKKKSTKGKWRTRMRKWISKKRQPAPFVEPASAVVVVANFDIEKGASVGVESEVPVIKRERRREGEPGARPKSFFKRMSLHIKK